MITRQLLYNVTPIVTRAIEYIVIHDTGNKGKGANAMANFNYFNMTDRGASADFFVDENDVWKVNDYRKYYTWHCGDGHGMYGITNKNSIGVEICVNTDGNYEKAVENTIELVRKLKQEFSKAKVVRHYDASRKMCPASMGKNNWELWNIFLERVDSMNWEEVIKKCTTDPDGWIKCINAAVEFAKANSNIGDLEQLKYLPELITKIYAKPN